MSIDVFGRVSLKRVDADRPGYRTHGEHSDFVAPMIYPSLWWAGYLDFANPTAHPYEVILETLKEADLQFEGKYAKQRPWLQDHTDPGKARVSWNTARRKFVLRSTPPRTSARRRVGCSTIPQPPIPTRH